MVAYIAKRLAVSIATVVMAYSLTFLLVQLSSSTPGAVRLGVGATPEQIEAENERLGWNRPLGTQYVEGLGSLARFDLGASLISGADITDDLIDRIPVTASVAGLATLLAGAVGTVLGVTAAVRGRFASGAVTTGAGVALSLPAFWLGIILIYFFSIQFDLFPATGYTPLLENPIEWLRNLALPVTTLAVGGAATVARVAAVGMREALAKEHINTLRAVGTPEWRIRYVHALRSASLPVVSVLSIQFIVLFGGSVIIESLFALPGLGQAALGAAIGQDFPALVGVVVVSTAVVVVTNLLLDLALAALDPKLRTS